MLSHYPYTELCWKLSSVTATHDLPRRWIPEPKNNGIPNRRVPGLPRLCIFRKCESAELFVCSRCYWETRESIPRNVKVLVGMDYDSHLPSSSSSSSSQGGVNRATLACIPCRTRHVRCDATKPACRRCLAENKTCRYAVSRRGGLTRAALAARRNLAATEVRTSNVERAPRDVCSQLGQAKRHFANGSDSLSLDNTCLSQMEVNQPASNHTRPFNPVTPIIDVGLPSELLNISGDRCIDLYYQHFHPLHPCVVPRPCLERLLQDPAKHLTLRPLVATMRHIGSLYCQSCQAEQLREEATSIIAAVQQHSRDAFMVQTYMINSIALYWGGDPVRSREEMDSAIHLALDLKMQCREFVLTHGEDDPVLQESWRRTWWQIYIVDAYYAAMKHAPTYSTCDVEATTELPCEENEYQSGVCRLPNQYLLPKSLTICDVSSGYSNPEDTG